MSANLNFSGNFPFDKLKLNNLVIFGANLLAHFLRTMLGILSGPGALLMFIFSKCSLSVDISSWTKLRPSRLQ